MVDRLPVVPELVVVPDITVADVPELPVVPELAVGPELAGGAGLLLLGGGNAKLCPLPEGGGGSGPYTYRGLVSAVLLSLVLLPTC